MRRILVLLATMVTGVLLASGLALAAEVSEEEPNDSIDEAQDIDDASFDLSENADIAASTHVPHATVNGTGDDTFDYYSFTVPAGDRVRVVLDIDHTTIVTPPPGDSIYDSWIELYDSSGARLDFNDDDGGDPGSEGYSIDSRIATTLDPGIYYVAVGRFASDETTQQQFMAEIPDTATYQLHMSVGNDTIPPVTTITDGPADGSLVNPGFATFFFSASEESTFECRLDQQGDFTSCFSGEFYTGLSVGSHIFEVRATDLAGNVEDPPVSRTWTVSDGTPPTILTFNPPDGAKKVSRTNPNITVTFSEEMAPFPANSFTLRKVKGKGKNETSLGIVSTWVQNPAAGQLNPNVVRLALGEGVTLDKGSHYRVGIPGGFCCATDLVGNPLQVGTAWHFKTGPK